MPRPNPERKVLANNVNSVRNNLSGGTTTFVLSDYGYYALNRTYTSAATPNFRLVSRQALPNNGHSVYAYSDSLTGGSWVHKRKFWNQSAWTVQSDVSWKFMTHNSVCSKPVHLGGGEQMAIGRLLKQLASIKLNAAQAFAERRQTASLLASSVTRIAQAAHALRRARLGDFVVALGLQDDRGRIGVTRSQWKRVEETSPRMRLSQHWLEFKYGWMPLLSDVHGAAELLAFHATGWPYHHRIRSSANVSTVTGWNQVDYAEGTGSPRHWATNTDVAKTKLRYTVDYRLDSQSKALLAQTGISNPALLAWELVPYSFVVDWFIPVGNYLEAINAASGFEFVRGTRSYLTVLRSTKVYHDTGWYASGSGGAWHNEEKWSGTWERTHFLYDRVPLSQMPGPLPPTFQNPLGGNALDRFATGLALLQTAFGKK